jgi:hypothetical protein
MKRKDIDWSILRFSIIILFICMLVSGVLISSSFYFKDKMLNDYNSHNAMFRSVSNKYFAVDEEEKLIKKFYPVFVQLYNSGVIGRELRLNWVETLRKAGDEIKMSSLTYEIHSQEVYTPAFPVMLGRYTLFRSVMNLNMQLLHEEDLFRLFEILDREAKGAYNVSNCTITSTTSKITEAPGSANLSARCELVWHSIKLADGTDLKV